MLSFLKPPLLPLRYALVDFGLAQGTPDTQIELLKVLQTKKQGSSSQSNLHTISGHTPVPREVVLPSSAKQSIKRHWSQSQINPGNRGKVLSLLLLFLLKLQIVTPHAWLRNDCECVVFVAAAAG